MTVSVAYEKVTAIIFSYVPEYADLQENPAWVVLFRPFCEVREPNKKPSSLKYQSSNEKR